VPAKPPDFDSQPWIVERNLDVVVLTGLKRRGPLDSTPLNLGEPEHLLLAGRARPARDEYERNQSACPPEDGYAGPPGTAINECVIGFVRVGGVAYRLGQTDALQ
jgi:hypothetical protein